jgi:hypothetical protein
MQSLTPTAHRFHVYYIACCIQSVPGLLLVSARGAAATPGERKISEG